MKKIIIKHAKVKILSGSIGHIGFYKSGILTESKLPISVVIVDEETNEEFECQLVSCYPFQSVIPEIASYYSEGLPPEQCTEQLLLKNKVSNINQLALYIYVRNVC